MSNLERGKLVLKEVPAGEVEKKGCYAAFKICKNSFR
jgi:hypothetical protein